MTVLITSHMRETLAQQHTYRRLKEAGIDVNVVVQACRFREMLEILPHEDVKVLPPRLDGGGISATRDWLIGICPRPLIMMDDDLIFYTRRKDDPTKFVSATDGDLHDMVHAIEKALLDYPMVGIGAREGGNRNTELTVENTRIMRVIGLDTQYLQQHAITCAPMELMEDFHLNLQILRSGADTLVLNKWVNNQAGGSNAPGGCSTTRSPALQTAQAHLLAQRHPGFVKVVQKATKTAWGGGTRTDVTVQWKAARRSAS